MHDSKSDAPPNAHLGLRVTVGVIALALLAMVFMLGSVAMKQSATTQSVDTQASPRGDPEYGPARD